MIQKFEELSLSAWPSLQTEDYDGWILRFSNGFTKRANSVNPLYDSSLDLDKKIDYCENVYRDKGLRPTYKITNEARPINLDDTLTDRGYKVIDTTSLQVVELNNILPISIEGGEFSDIHLEEWIEAYCSLNARAAKNRATLQEMLEMIAAEKAFVALQRDGRAIACAMAVLERGFLGLFNIVVDNSFRNQGCGKQISLNLMHWGKQNGAKQAYLQVTVDNAAAKKIYSTLGFREEYQYWYRVKD